MNPELHLLNTKPIILGPATWSRSLVASLLARSCSQSSLCCAATLTSGTRSVARTNVIHGRHGSTHGRNREPHRHARNEHCHKAHCNEATQQHVQTLTAQLQTLTRNPTTQALAQLTGLIDTKFWRKLGKLDPSAKGGWNDWESSCLASDS